MIEIIWREKPNINPSVRNWPTGLIVKGKTEKPLVIVHCLDEYVPWKAMCVEHRPLKISIYNESKKLVTVKREFESMIDVRLWLREFFTKLEKN